MCTSIHILFLFIFFATHFMCFSLSLHTEVLISLMLFLLACFFTSSGGLRSFEHPMNELKPVPRVDSSGQVCGSTFKVDAETKKETGMPRVGSAANWSTNL